MHTSSIVRSATSLLAVWASLPLSVGSPVELNGADLTEAIPLDAAIVEEPIALEPVPAETESNETLPDDTASTEGQLEKRCDNPCGFYSQLCCASGETCGTNNGGEAVCVGSSGDSSNGRWEYWTTTIIDSSTITSVGSSYVSQPTKGASDDTGSCRAALGETKCGKDCCGSAYVCVNDKCVMGSSSIWATATEANPPVRGTSATTLTATADVTATQGFDAPVGTDGASLIGVKAEDGGLSGGAIAGIVIGTIAGVFLLLLICACLCCRGMIEALFACLGIGKRKKKETTYVEDHHSHHTHAHTGAAHGGWFGSRPPGESHGEKKSKWSSLATLGIIVGAIALCLGLKRHNKDDEKSSTSHPSSYSYYTYSYSSPSSSESSDRQTRYSRRSRRSPRSRRS